MNSTKPPTEILNYCSMLVALTA